MNPRLSALALAAVVGALSAVAHAEPPAAKPALYYATASRQRIAAGLESLLAKETRTQVTLVRGWLYQEQDGSSTMCGVASFGGPRAIFVVNTTAGTRLSPTENEFGGLGCSRDGKADLR